MRWLFLGAGNMASSLIGGLCVGGTAPNHIAVVDPDVETCQRAEKAFGVLSAASAEQVMTLLFADTDADTRRLGVIIAVKPHIVEIVCRALSACLQQSDQHDLQLSSTVCISVAAGVRVNTMQGWLPDNTAVVRCMPNTPALLGLGITALYASEQCSSEDRDRAQSLLNCAGKTLWVDDETLLDAVTAVSGSGPAYFFYLIEHITQAGVTLGLPHDTAANLAIETAYGAASMARPQQLSAAMLRENVTSKGGTTAAALQVFDQHNTPDIIQSALKAAHQRAIELGDEFAS